MIRILLLLTLLPVYGKSQLSVAHLRCEYKENPAGIESLSPLLGWQLQSKDRAVKQAAYRILVADDPSLLQKDVGNLWDSRKVNSGQSIQVRYTGKTLRPAKSIYWKVMVWDNQARPSGWSAVGSWQVGLLTKRDWKGARWIAYEKIPDSLVSILPTDGKKDTYKGKNVLPLVRKSFRVHKKVKNATIFISGLGHFELSMNGSKVGDHFLDPGWTKYDKEALYVPFDVTQQLKEGENVIGVMLGNGFYYIPPVSGRYRKLKTAFGYPKMIARLVIEYSDGSTEDVVSDPTWKTAPGPITFSSIYGGEDYDARLEQKGWDSPGFNDAGWKEVVTVNGPALNAQMTEPLKVMQTFIPQKRFSLKDSSWVFDLGQNASGIPQIELRGRRGDTVRVIPAELLKSDSAANQRASGSPYFLEYVLKGDGVETWQPRFTYYGFRYLQVRGAVPEGEKNPAGLPVLLGIKGLHTRNAAPTIGTFQCSNTLLNQSYALIDWAIKSNMASVFTDCPHREKLGWLEQAHLMGSSVCYTYDAVHLFRKQVRDMRYSQTVEGLVPEIAPEYIKFEWGGDMFRDSPEWGSSAIIVPWYLYQWYGDKSVLRDHYDMMKRYAAYLQSKAKGFILLQGLGDWYDLGPRPPGVSQLTPMGVTGTAIYYYDLGILSKIARLLNKPGEAKAFERLAGQVKKAFNDTFFNKQTKQYATGSQTANAMAVYMGLVATEDKAAVIDNIVRDIRSRNNSLTAGDIGYRYLLRVLHEAGRSDVIFDMNSRTDVPGYGYQIARGATALTESWEALPTASNNHFMLGHLMEWFYRGLLGINQAEGSVAFQDIVIRPEPVGDVTAASGSFQSLYGTISSRWKKTADGFWLEVEVPANASATVYLPATTASKILEGTDPISNAKGIRLAGFESGRAKLKVGSGVYTFTVKG